MTDQTQAQAEGKTAHDAYWAAQGVAKNWNRAGRLTQRAWAAVEHALSRRAPPAAEGSGAGQEALRRLQEAAERAENEESSLAAPDGTVAVQWRDLRALLSPPEGGLVEALEAAEQALKPFAFSTLSLQPLEGGCTTAIIEDRDIEEVRSALLQLTAALAAHARQGGGGGWHSLEFAPRDEGSLIILRHDDHPEGLRVAQFKTEGNSGPGWYPTRSDCWVVRDKSPYRDWYLWAHVPALAPAQAGGGVG